MKLDVVKLDEGGYGVLNPERILMLLTNPDITDREAFSYYGKIVIKCKTKEDILDKFFEFLHTELDNYHHDLSKPCPVTGTRITGMAIWTTEDRPHTLNICANCAFNGEQLSSIEGVSRKGVH